MSSFFIGCLAKAACSSDEMPKWQISLFPMDEIEPPDYPDLISWSVGRCQPSARRSYLFSFLSAYGLLVLRTVILIGIPRKSKFSRS